MSSWRDTVIASLIRDYGNDPHLVGAEDGTEDEWGDLVLYVAELLDVDVEDDEQWQHFQDVAMECRADNMAAWFTHLETACQ